MATVDIDLGAYKLGWHDSEDAYVFKPQKGLNEEIIRQMSEMKGEPEWMLEFRLKAYKRFLAKPLPNWGGGGSLDFVMVGFVDFPRLATRRDCYTHPLFG